MDYHDENDPGNDVRYLSGRTCVEPGCSNPAGTAWGPYWCWRHNAERLDRVTASLERLTAAWESR
jgi:hypothetical protein